MSESVHLVLNITFGLLIVLALVNCDTIDDKIRDFVQRVKDRQKGNDVKEIVENARDRK